MVSYGVEYYEICFGSNLTTVGYPYMVCFPGFLIFGITKKIIYVILQNLKELGHVPYTAPVMYVRDRAS